MKIITADPIMRQLFEHCKKKRISCVEISNRTSISVATIYNWSKGRTTANMIDVTTFADAIGLELVLKKKED